MKKEVRGGVSLVLASAMLGGIADGGRNDGNSSGRGTYSR